MEITLKKDEDVAPGARRGPGRPKGSTNAARATRTETENLKQALAAMESTYDALGMGLVLFGLPDTATSWADTAKTLSESNERALKSSPRLAAMIARAGSAGGAGAFVIAHAVALAGLVSAARTELFQRRAQAVIDEEQAREASANG